MVVVNEERAEETLYIGSSPPSTWPPGGSDSDLPESGSAFPVSKGRLALWLLLGSITMLFGGFSSAYIVLRGVPSWQNVVIPSVLWLNTFILLASSLTIEFTRRSIRKDRTGPMKMWIVTTGALGVAFLAGQVVAWQQMVAAGVYLPSTLHSSFIYILTGMHGLHLTGGLGGLTFVLFHTLRNRYSARAHEHIRLCATYWHFMGALWVYLFLMFLLA